MYVKMSGARKVEFTDTSGTPGAATQRTACGRVAIAIGASTVTVTNPHCKANSLIHVTKESNDATSTFVKSVVPSAGSFVITVNANATAACVFSYEIVNPA